MKRAIVLPYCVDQNEPSVPLRTILEVPDNKVELETILRSIFLDRICDDEEMLSECELTTEGCEYGDIEYGTDDLFLFLTFLDE